jgi:hypothetical protein
MKKLLVISIFCLFSCSTYKMNNREIKNLKYEVDGWDILKDSHCVANIREMEWELYEGKLTREITMTICDPKTRDKDLIEIIKFVHTKYPEYKIEVNRENEFTRWLLNRENKNKK